MPTTLLSVKSRHAVGNSPAGLVGEQRLTWPSGARGQGALYPPALAAVRASQPRAQEPNITEVSVGKTHPSEGLYLLNGIIKYFVTCGLGGPIKAKYYHTICD